MDSTASFSNQDMQEVVDIGYLNGETPGLVLMKRSKQLRGFSLGLFVLGRTIGLVGHALDQKRLHQPLYRHPWDDVMYTQ